MKIKIGLLHPMNFGITHRKMSNYFFIDADVVAPNFFATSIIFTISPQLTKESALITTAGFVSESAMGKRDFSTDSNESKGISSWPI